MKLLIILVVKKSYLILKFILLVFWEVILANLRVARQVISPRLRLKPGVIAIPLTAKTAVEITLFANVITLTPGTLTLDISADKKSLYLHTMFVDNIDELKAELKRKYEKPIMEILQ